MNHTGTNIYMLFAGPEVRIGKNCARVLEYGPRPQAEGCTQDRGHSFSQYDMKLDERQTGGGHTPLADFIG